MNDRVAEYLNLNGVNKAICFGFVSVSQYVRLDLNHCELYALLFDKRSIELGTWHPGSLSPRQGVPDLEYRALMASAKAAEAQTPTAGLMAAWVN